QLLRWSCFDAFATPAGSPWPRRIRYTGSDHGFFAWPAARAKLAHAAYDLAEQGLGQAQDLEQAQAALRLFTARFNSVKGMETGEREDLGEAVWQLAQLPQAQALGLSAELAQQCFDEARNY
ncbi:MAG: hypothetical protein RR283_11545, partial [Comamonas sp.]